MHGRPSPARIPAVSGEMPSGPVGEFVDLEGESYFRIAEYDRLHPFLMSLPSDTDLWMFVASGGGLTAGRVDADGALFPYETVDRLHDAHHHTGPVTVVRVELDGGGCHRWEPFSAPGAENPAIERFLYKNDLGNRLVFEEVHRGLGLVFRYRWAASNEFGWVRTATLENRGPGAQRISLLDGLRNLLPFGAPLGLYQQASTLVDAYKKSEVDPDTGLGIFSLTAQITDRTQPLEMLRANTVWCCGLPHPRFHLGLDSIEAFRSGHSPDPGHELNGVRGNYLVSSNLLLEPGEHARWHLAGDTGLDHLRVAALRRQLRESEDPGPAVEASLDSSSEGLRRNVAGADGLQIGADTASCVHHFANVLFNNMRGGVFADGYEIPTEDFRSFLHGRNRSVADRHADTLAGLGASCRIDQVLAKARGAGDADLERLCLEYLPLYFSRRHGDPSRPWNRFSIRARNGNGERELNFEGNWRDIFQNWEALAMAFPGFLPSIVAKFVNASTVDGFNPYRITRAGFEWEVPAPDDPWSNIGYWGDHQIVYLLRLLEALDRFDPTALPDLLGREIFAYAEVPYRLRDYGEIVRDPRATIDYDVALATRIEERTARIGADGQLLHDAEGRIHRVNLLEKLVVPALSKLSNLVVDGGIWMNTQRPEWNDANNALGGGGVSVVTLAHLRRYLDFLAGRLEDADDGTLTVSTEVVEWFGHIEAALSTGADLIPAAGVDPAARRRLLDELGGAFSAYRVHVYTHGFGGKTPLEISRVARFFRAAVPLLDRAIDANRREDGLYHTYNRLRFTDDGVEVLPLSEMLEGQVAVLGSGALRPAAALELMEHLFDSALYRPDARSFQLYPDRELPGFLEKNVVPESALERIPLLADLIEAGEASLLARDADGILRFHGDLSAACDADRVLTRLAEDPQWLAAVERDREAVLAFFDEVFDHEAYTGRSGVMYGYEGLGCIYWHMVAKLMLAVQEQCLAAREGAVDARTQQGLDRMYFRVRDGIGYRKRVDEYGAFPTDPYSHTPAGGGARQPGMTGQVKEEILTRMGELGLQVAAGAVRFAPSLLLADELLPEGRPFAYFDVEGRPGTLEVPANGLGFTFCQTPVVYECARGAESITVIRSDGSAAESDGTALDADLSRELFARSGRIRAIRVRLAPGRFVRT